MTTFPSPARLDLWLWAARFFKTRSLAKQAIEGGKITHNDGSPKAAKLVHVGDRIGISRGFDRMHVVVIGVSVVRGPASVAQSLYEETPESRKLREEVREMRRLTGAGQDHPPSRPDKRSRRLLRGFKEGSR